MLTTGEDVSIVVILLLADKCDLVAAASIQAWLSV